MPCNLVRMLLQVGVRRDVPNLGGVRVQEAELCQPAVWMTNAAIFTSSVEKSQRATGPSPS
eukprot:2507073-Pleurochrysis_carterae.AAC.1